MSTSTKVVLIIGMCLAFSFSHVSNAGAQSASFMSVTATCLETNPKQEKLEWKVAEDAPYNLSMFFISDAQGDNEAVMFYDSNDDTYEFIDMTHETVFFITAKTVNGDKLAGFGPFAPCLDPVNVDLGDFKVTDNSEGQFKLGAILLIGVAVLAFLLSRLWNYRFKW